MNQEIQQFNFNQFFQDPQLDCYGYQSHVSHVLQSELSNDSHPDAFCRYRGSSQLQSFKIQDFLYEISPQNQFQIAQGQRREKQKQNIKKPKKRIRRIKNYEKERYYEKNVCRNILRKSIRCLTLYDQKIKEACDIEQCDDNQFSTVLNNNMELLSGPSALKAYLSEGSRVAYAYKKYLKWFLKDRYLREAIRQGHMKDLKKYIEYKNNVLLPILE